MNTLVVKAGPGTGKSTTLLAGINKVFCGKQPPFEESDRQTAIFQWMDDNCIKGDVTLLAFNKSIATELQDKIEHGEAKTIHSLGASLCYTEIRGYGRPRMDKWKTTNIFCDLVGAKNMKALSKDQREILDDVRQAVAICKDRIVTPADLTADDLRGLCIDRSFIPATASDVLFSYVKQVLTYGTDLTHARGQSYDFDDMIYMPVLHGWTKSFDNLMIDEAQDLSYGKMQFILSMDCENYIFVGDTNQAIYAFAGADSDALSNLLDMTDGDQLPLDTSWRCATAIVDYAQQYMTEGELHARPGAPEGLVKHDGNINDVTPEDLVVCRVNAPIFSLAWSLIKQRIPAYIVGHDLGKNLGRLVKKCAGKSGDLSVMLDGVNAWAEKQIELVQKRKRNDMDDAIIRINDQRDCLFLLAEDADTVDDMYAAINMLFDADRSKVRLSSIHRAKGLEANRVFWYAPENTPHPMAKTEEAIKQEKNLQFVAITRAKNELHLIPGKKKA